MIPFRSPLMLGALALLAMPAVARAQVPTAHPRPTPPQAAPFALPAFAVDTLPNGLRYAVLENQ